MRRRTRQCLVEEGQLEKQQWDWAGEVKEDEEKGKEEEKEDKRKGI